MVGANSVEVEVSPLGSTMYTKVATVVSIVILDS